jgi:probable F420-dependent oxidoreductase
VTHDFGRVGASVGLAELTDEQARELEDAGYGALWVGPSVAPDLLEVERVLRATASISVVTAITTIWSATPSELAASFRRVHDRFGDRFLLGLGTAHAGVNAPLQARPLQAMTAMLDGLDEAGVPAQGRLLAALGPRMLQLAGERSRGAHPYLAPTSLTADARRVLGPDALLAAALLVAATDDEQEALAIGRTAVEAYLTLDNYRRNFLRAGFTEDDLEGGGSERLIRALVVSMRGVTEAVGAHLGASADHVSIGIRTRPGQDSREGYRRAAELLDLH